MSWTIQVAASDPDRRRGIEAMQYFPRTLVVAVGDVVRFSFEPPGNPFHSVTFLGGESAPWRNGVGPALPDGSVEVLGTVPNVALGLEPIPYDGTGLLNSGVPGLLGPDVGRQLCVKFMRAGVHEFVDVLHPGQTGWICAIDGEPPETPEQAHERGQREWETLLARTIEGRALLEPAAHAPGAHGVLTGFAEGEGASAQRFIPDELHVKQGDVVVWTNAAAPELHSVLFLSDGRPVDPIELRPRNAGPPQAVIPARYAQRHGGEVFTGDGHLTSGLLRIGQQYALRIEAPPGVYRYTSLMHQLNGQHATLVVEEP